MLLFRTNAFLVAALTATPFLTQAQFSDAPSDVPSLTPSVFPSAIPAPDVFTSVVQDIPNGLIAFYDNRNGDLESDPDAVTLTLDYLYELDVFDRIVGADEHSLETFAGQEFLFSSPEMTELNGFTASTFSFETSVSTVGTIKIDTYILYEGGVLQTDTNETFEVSPGDFKFNIELLDWSWCAPCDGRTSTHMDVGIEIKGSKDTPTEEDLGGGIPVILASNIKIGDEIVPMPDGYPKIVSREGKSVFVFRFPKNGGVDSYFYDPVIGMGQKNQDDASSCRGLFCICR